MRSRHDRLLFASLQDLHLPKKSVTLGIDFLIFTKALYLHYVTLINAISYWFKLNLQDYSDHIILMI